MASTANPVPGSAEPRTSDKRVCFEVVQDLRALVATGRLDRADLHQAAAHVVEALNRSHAEALATLPFLRTPQERPASATAARAEEQAAAIVRQHFGPLPPAIRDQETPLAALPPAWQAIHLVTAHLRADDGGSTALADRVLSAHDLAMTLAFEAQGGAEPRPRMLGGAPQPPGQDVVRDWLVLSTVSDRPRPAALLRVDAAVAALSGPGAATEDDDTLDSAGVAALVRATGLDEDAAELLSPHLGQPLTVDRSLPEEARGAALGSQVQALRGLHRAQEHHRDVSRLREAHQGSSGDIGWSRSLADLRAAEHTVAATTRLLSRLRLALPTVTTPDHPGLYGGSALGDAGADDAREAAAQGAAQGAALLPAASFGLLPRPAADTDDGTAEVPDRYVDGAAVDPAAGRRQDADDAPPSASAGASPRAGQPATERRFVLEELLARDGNLDSVREVANRTAEGAPVEAWGPEVAQHLAERLRPEPHQDGAPVRQHGRVVLELADVSLATVAMLLAQQAADVLGHTVALGLLPGTAPVEVCPSES